MAPLTRGRAGDARVPNDLMVEYYRQRADAGLIISEATAISAEGFGWGGAPGDYTDAQEAGWRRVTDAVHAGRRTDRVAALAYGAHVASGIPERPYPAGAVRRGG